MAAVLTWSTKGASCAWLEPIISLSACSRYSGSRPCATQRREGVASAVRSLPRINACAAHGLWGRFPRTGGARLHLAQQYRQVGGEVARRDVAQRGRRRRLHLVEARAEGVHHLAHERLVAAQVVGAADLAQAQQRQHAALAVGAVELAHEARHHRIALARLRRVRAAHGDRLRERREARAREAGGGEGEEAGRQHVEGELGHLPHEGRCSRGRHTRGGAHEDAAPARGEALRRTPCPSSAGRARLLLAQLAEEVEQPAERLALHQRSTA